METSLLESLHHKLRDLEHNLQTYRHDMVSDFRRHYHAQLRDVDPAVAASVHRAIAQSLPDYPMLRPGLEPELAGAAAADAARPDLRPAANPGSAAFQPPPQPAVSGDAPDSSSSPHERETEFHGLFTPSYLPLLESSPAAAADRSPPAAGDDDDASAPGSSQPSAPASPGPGAGLGVVVDMDGPGAADGARGSPHPDLQLPERPHHARNSTDDTTSTGTSDRSETKAPRSALRRSSSSAKPPQSPRRVRFEVMGAEVLPTASPQSTAVISPDPLPPGDQGDPVVSDSILGVNEEEEKEDLLPPRKISSSEALRALSRTPLEEGTVWTVVNPETDEGSSTSRDSPPATLSSSPNENSAPQPAAPVPAKPVDMAEPSPQPALGRVCEVPEVEDDESSDEEFLAMGKSKSFANKKAISPVSISPTKVESPVQEKEESSGPAASDAGVKGQSQPREVETEICDAEADDDVDGEEVDEVDEDEDDDDDELFHFETGGLTAPPKPRPRPPPLKKETSDDEESALPNDTATSPGPNYSSSPAVKITARPQAPAGPPTPTTAKFQAGSLGSYKGRPVEMPVVRDPDIHTQAASLGQFNTFVGGLDGRSGMDEGDLSSFRASVAPPGFSGTPRSFSERFMMEEAKREGKGGGDTPQ